MQTKLVIYDKLSFLKYRKGINLNVAWSLQWMFLMVDCLFSDSYGDTAWHDAIGKEKQDIIEGLINFPIIDFTLKNKRGFNVLHHAALKGNNL